MRVNYSFPTGDLTIDDLCVQIAKLTIMMIPLYSFHSIYLSSQEPSSLFIIAGASGVIRLTGTLDYEHAVFHQLEIVATVGYSLLTYAF